MQARTEKTGTEIQKCLCGTGPRKSSAILIKTASVTAAAPTPIPAFAPVERPDEDAAVAEGDELLEDVGLLVGAEDSELEVVAKSVLWYRIIAIDCLG